MAVSNFSSYFGSGMSSSSVGATVTPSPIAAIATLEEELFGNFGFELVDSAADSSVTPSRKRTTRGPGKRFYAVVRVPAESKLVVGVWHCEWSTLRKGLKNGNLFGSGVSLKGFDVKDDAIAYCKTKLKTERDFDVPIYSSTCCEGGCFK